jgi:hypothetical protein
VQHAKGVAAAAGVQSQGRHRGSSGAASATGYEVSPGALPGESRRQATGSPPAAVVQPGAGSRPPLAPAPAAGRCLACEQRVTADAVPVDEADVGAGKQQRAWGPVRAMSKGGGGGGCRMVRSKPGFSCNADGSKLPLGPNIEASAAVSPGPVAGLPAALLPFPGACEIQPPSPELSVQLTFLPFLLLSASCSSRSSTLEWPPLTGIWPRRRAATNPRCAGAGRRLQQAPQPDATYTRQRSLADPHCGQPPAALPLLAVVLPAPALLHLQAGLAAIECAPSSANGAAARRKRWRAWPRCLQPSISPLAGR